MTAITMFADAGEKIWPAFIDNFIGVAGAEFKFSEALPGLQWLPGPDNQAPFVGNTSSPVFVTGGGLDGNDPNDDLVASSLWYVKTGRKLADFETVFSNRRSGNGIREFTARLNILPEAAALVKDQGTFIKLMQTAATGNVILAFDETGADGVAATQITFDLGVDTAGSIHEPWTIKGEWQANQTDLKVTITNPLRSGSPFVQTFATAVGTDYSVSGNMGFNFSNRASWGQLKYYRVY